MSRKEKEKLLKYEKKIQELTQLTQSGKVKFTLTKNLYFFIYNIT